MFFFQQLQAVAVGENAYSYHDGFRSYFLILF
jgi:hypothetical protein